MHAFRIKPSMIKGTITVPASKSHTMRALLFGALAQGKSCVSHCLPSPDTTHMINACKLFGARFMEKSSETIEIEGVGGEVREIEDVIHAGNSGIILRFVTAVLALSPYHAVITGDQSLRSQRPMGTLLDALRQLGVDAVSSRANGYAPLIIRGPLKGGKAILPGEDSQPVSSLLIACSQAMGPTELIVKNPGEKPWVQLTLHWLDRLGVAYAQENYEKYTLHGGARFRPFDYAVPGDWSSAAFPLAAALVTGSSLTIANVDMEDPQGDKEIVAVLQKMGAPIEIDALKKELHVKAGGLLKGATIDLNPIIDVVTILAVVACFAEGETRLINGSVARVKECDRLRCITQELQKMGARISETEDGLLIQGGSLKGAAVESHGDHRMALSLAVAALGAKGESIIHHVDCAAKTFPHFVESFQSLGAEIDRVKR